RLPSAAGVRPWTGGLPSVVGVIASGRPHAGCDLQLVGQERPERCAGHSASHEDWYHAAVSGSAGDRAPGSAGTRENLPAGLTPEGAPAAQHRDAPFTAVLSRGGALSAQFS